MRRCIFLLVLICIQILAAESTAKKQHVQHENSKEDGEPLTAGVVARENALDKGRDAEDAYRDIDFSKDELELQGTVCVYAYICMQDINPSVFFHVQKIRKTNKRKMASIGFSLRICCRSSSRRGTRDASSRTRPSRSRNSAGLGSCRLLPRER